MASVPLLKFDCPQLSHYTQSYLALTTTLFSQYTTFILLNALLLGSFIPFWSRECWSDTYLRRVHWGDTGWKGRLVKVVGMYYELCARGTPDI